VEDFYWAFGPNAVTLSAFDAQSNPSNLAAVILAGIALLGVVAAGLILQARRREG
jgi:hypothetical protein